MKLYYRLFGYCTVSAHLSCAADLLNVCMQYRYAYRDMKTDGEHVSLVCTLHTASRIKFRAEALGIKIELSKPRGLPSFVWQYRKRAGLWIGLAAAVAMVWLSGRFVWDIRVTGNESLTPREIEEVLASCGFSRGSAIAGFNADLTEARAQLACDKLAWISVNVKGTVAYVEVREKLPIDETPKPTSPANIVAAQSGKVLEVIAYNGLAMVKAGDEVKSGDLLISGVYGEHTPGLRVTRASGYVKARTVRSFLVEIPYEHTEKVYTGNKNEEKHLNFFQKSLKVFVNSGNLGATCDKIYREEEFSFFGARLPFSITTITELEYQEVSARYTEQQASALAEERLSVLLSTELEGAEILSKNVIGLAGKDSYVLSCEIICVEDISLIQEFEVQLTD